MSYLDLQQGDTVSIYLWLSISDSFPNIGSFSISLRYNDTLSPSFEALDAGISDIWALYAIHGVNWEGDTSQPSIEGVVIWYAGYPIANPYGPGVPYYVGYITLVATSPGSTVLDTVAPTFIADTSYENFCFPEFDSIPVSIITSVDEGEVSLPPGENSYITLVNGCELFLPCNFERADLVSVTGRIIETFYNDRRISLGNVPSGVYFIRLKGRGYNSSLIKLLYIR